MQIKQWSKSFVDFKCSPKFQSGIIHSSLYHFDQNGAATRKVDPVYLEVSVMPLLLKLGLEGFFYGEAL